MIEVVNDASQVSVFLLFEDVVIIIGWWFKVQ